LARWLETLAEFDYEIEHRPGRLRCNANGVSRPILSSVGENLSPHLGLESLKEQTSLQHHLASTRFL